MKTFEKVYQVVRKIPEGKAMTYGQVAKLVGTTPELVGFALHVNPEEYDLKSGKGVPCHRVVRKDGTLARGFAFGGEDEQRLRLAAEGVRFKRMETAGKSRLVVDNNYLVEL